ncbi:hypothetical protein BJ912DRAFT_1075345 [Pholiota molesta]|nr:hypothetical protein BJ912DRAFT_1075345 [Pholiota molesta]
MQRARQFATKFLQMEPATLLAVIPPADASESTPQDFEPPDSTTPIGDTSTTAILATWPTPAPATFTISYTPLSISYPDPIDPTTPLETDAVRVTRHELAAMLQQSYLHGSEHGWKAIAQQQLQAQCDNNIRAALARLDKTMAQIREQGYNCGFKEAQIQLKAKYERRQLDALRSFGERAQEISDGDFNRGFNDGRDAGIREEFERRESTRAKLDDCSIQTDPPEHKIPPSVDFSMQTEPLEPERTLSVNCGMQTDMPEPPSSVASPQFLPIAVASSDPTPFVWSDEPSEVQILLLPIVTPSSAPTTSTSFPNRDFSDLRSGMNPWQSLQHRKGRDRRRSTQSLRQRGRQRPTYTTHTYPTMHYTHIPCTPLLNMPYDPPPNPPAPLDWHVDPRLFELSHVLKTLGWVPPLTPRP